MAWYDFIKKAAPYAGAAGGFLVGGPAGAAGGYAGGSALAAGIDAVDGDSPEVGAEKDAQAQKLAMMQDAAKQLQAYRPISQEAQMQGMRNQIGMYSGVGNTLSQMYGPQAAPTPDTQNPFSPGRGPGSPGGPMYSPPGGQGPSINPMQRPMAPQGIGSTGANVMGGAQQLPQMQRPMAPTMMRQQPGQPLSLRELMERQ